jgi:hypothetical protein
MQGVTEVLAYGTAVFVEPSKCSTVSLFFIGPRLRESKSPL